MMTGPTYTSKTQYRQAYHVDQACLVEFGSLTGPQIARLTRLVTRYPAEALAICLVFYATKITNRFWKVPIVLAGWLRRWHYRRRLGGLTDMQADLVLSCLQHYLRQYQTLRQHILARVTPKIG